MEKVIKLQNFSAKSPYFLTLIRLGLLRVVFSGFWVGGGVNLPPSSVSYITLCNCWTIFLKYVEIDIMLTSSVTSWRLYFLCNKDMSKNPKNWWKLLKIANIGRESLNIFKMRFMIILKVTKNQGFTLSLQDALLGKRQGEGTPHHQQPIPASLGLMRAGEIKFEC